MSIKEMSIEEKAVRDTYDELVKLYPESKELLDLILEARI